MEGEKETIHMYEFIAHIEGIEIPNDFENELIGYINNFDKKHYLASIMAKMLKEHDSETIKQFMDEIEEFIRDYVTDFAKGVQETEVEEFTQYMVLHLFRTIIKFHSMFTK